MISFFKLILKFINIRKPWIKFNLSAGILDKIHTISNGFLPYFIAKINCCYTEQFRGGLVI